MLACAQELYFQQTTNESNKEKRLLQQQQLDHVSNKEKEEQQVWPPDVEAAFIKALETIPKLGRRKILVNGKPCGRNELISDFIFRKTTKIRTRKQVSSHIQVLKNTRKGDPHFMRLLTDAVDADEGYVSTATNNQQQQKKKKTLNSNNSKFTTTATTTTTSNSSSISCSPSSPIDYSVFDLIYQQQQQNILDIKDPFYDPFLVDLNNNMTTTKTTTTTTTTSSTCSSFSSPITNENDLLLQQLINKQKSTRKQTKKKEHVLWPNYICLYLEYSPLSCYNIPIQVQPHTLANLPFCISNQLPMIDSQLIINQGKCPLLSEIITTKETTTILSAQIGLNLNLNMTDFYFNNTSFFETKDRRTIECTTAIYSFGNIVLESKETQQALWLNEGKYMYSFVYVNQFFDAFIKGIKSLQSWEEVDIAINNLCVVQVFQDIESTQNPLLVMIYEFERGQGTIDVCIVVEEEEEEEVVSTLREEKEEAFDFLSSSAATIM